MAERLDGPAVADRLTRIEAVLGELESIPGATAAKALDAAALLTEVYGEALARVLARLDEQDMDELVDDELVGHLMVLHEIHPEPLERRVERALERLRPILPRRGPIMEAARSEVRLRICGLPPSGQAPPISRYSGPSAPASAHKARILRSSGVISVMLPGGMAWVWAACR